MGQDREKQPILVSEAQFKNATRVVVAKWLLFKGYSPTAENIELFKTVAQNIWVKVADGREFPLWHFVEDESGRLSIDMASEKK